MKPVQYFSDEYLDRCRGMKPDQILRFLDDFRELHAAGTTSSSKLISLKVPQNLLNVFRARAESEGVRYQTQIKALMKAWALADRSD
jgi:hypothetical protein